MYKSSFIHIYLKHVYSQTSFIKAYNTMYFLLLLKERANEEMSTLDWSLHL